MTARRTKNRLSSLMTRHYLSTRLFGAHSGHLEDLNIFFAYHIYCFDLLSGSLNSMPSITVEDELFFISLLVKLIPPGFLDGSLHRVLLGSRYLLLELGKLFIQIVLVASKLSKREAVELLISKQRHLHLK